VRFLEALGVNPEHAGNAFTLTRALLTLGEEADDLRPGLPVLYRLRLASEQGYAPDFSTCGACGAGMADIAQPGRFLMRDGLLLCADCHARAGGEATALPAGALAALITVQHTLPEAWNDLALSSEDWRSCVRFADAFVQFHLGLSWEKGRFRRQ